MHPFFLGAFTVLVSTMNLRVANLSQTVDFRILKTSRCFYFKTKSPDGSKKSTAKINLRFLQRLSRFFLKKFVKNKISCGEKHRQVVAKHPVGLFLVG